MCVCVCVCVCVFVLFSRFKKNAGKIPIAEFYADFRVLYLLPSFIPIAEFYAYCRVVCLLPSFMPSKMPIAKLCQVKNLGANAEK